ncbi:hypothetical protein Aspvir_006019 [Aspergillus viridinutans]|uniref:Cupin type-1 domain-containing protein n=1 Tax=Aspergillus viridinutans TaxID=75553 RepID=A0A9P3F5F8_ASPVI|nr:uncharacterized protein Aspvir_006019 [Aspergillus viridinutans]GIK01976.1 hypothetical protein Aspvir_006019 [Aspergillus viridinutans]
MFPDFPLRSVIAVMLALVPLARTAPQPIMNSSTSQLSLTAQLRLADTAIERYKLLPKGEDFVFNFAGASLPIATSQNFPALVGTGISFSIAQLPACSMSFLHLHPRATELFAITSGRGHQRVIRAELGPGIVTIFPAGSFHTQVNPDCEPANFTAAFTSDEFAVGLVAAQTFSLSDDVIAATFGQTIAGEDIEKVRQAIPVTMAIKVEECLTNDFGADWHKIFLRIPQLLESQASAEEYHEHPQEPLREDTESTVRMSMTTPYHWALAVGRIHIVDRKMLATEGWKAGKVRIVFYDEFGRVVRSYRAEVDEAADITGVYDYILNEHPCWVHGKIGKDYMVGAPLGPPYQQDDCDETDSEGSTDDNE